MSLDSTLTPEQFGALMKTLDLSTISPENRSRAILDHAMKIMADHLIDRRAATALYSAYLLHQKAAHSHQ
jgi:hypothetical protein